MIFMIKKFVAKRSFESVKFSGFTMAEVLITLGVVGIVATMTLPSLIQKQQEKATVSRLKKAYSTISQAYLMARAKNGDLDTWGFQNNSGADPEAENGYSDATYDNQRVFMGKLMPEMKILSSCINDRNTCKILNIYSLTGELLTNGYSTNIILSDGASFSGGWISNKNCTKNQICGDFRLDINGFNKKPNKVGKDIFEFYIYRDKIMPMGYPEHKDRSFENYCNLNKKSKYNGYGCAAWVITNENMDYLHCSDLSWNGKKTCK